MTNVERPGPPVTGRAEQIGGQLIHLRDHTDTLTYLKIEKYGNKKKLTYFDPKPQMHLHFECT